MGIQILKIEVVSRHGRDAMHCVSTPRLLRVCYGLYARPRMRAFGARGGMVGATHFSINMQPLQG